MVPQSVRAGDILADRYQLADLLVESEGGMFWRARDLVLSRSVAVHVISAADPRAPLLMTAARRSAAVRDHRILQVLDAATIGTICYVVNEWGAGESLDILLTREGPMEPTRAAWLISEVAGALAVAHDNGVEHGRLVPENVLIDHNGNVRLIGLAVDAALHGSPAGQRSADIHNLAALLYAVLTDRWPGSPRSSIAAAPIEGRRVLRPRRVRAGIPRFLDDLCDVVLNRGRGGAHARLRYDLASAAGIAEALVEFVGQPEEYAAAERQRHGAVDADHPIGQVTAILPSMAAPPYLDPTEIEAARSAAAADPLETDTPDPEPAKPPPDDQPTQAGMPVFRGDDVSWVGSQDPGGAAKPLFAPEPAAGEPARTPRPGTSAAGQQPYWPWEAEGRSEPPPGKGRPSAASPRAAQTTGGRAVAAGTVRGGSAAAAGRTSGGSTTSSRGYLRAIVDPEDEVPGRNWLRLAMVIAVGALVVLAIASAYSLSQGRNPLDFGEPTPAESSASTSAAAAAAEPLTDLVAIDFDPQGDPPEENPDVAPLAVDGNPDTAWRTQIYKQQLGPGGIKSGVGLVIDLGSAAEITAVRVQFEGAPTTVRLYVSDDEVTELTGRRPVAEGVADGTELELALEAPVTGRYVVVWLTSLPKVAGGFRSRVAEVEVLGVRSGQ